jgi:hypothetical protein
MSKEHRQKINKVVADYVGATEGIPLWQELDQTSHSDLIEIIYQMAGDMVADNE